MARQQDRPGASVTSRSLITRLIETPDLSPRIQALPAPVFTSLIQEIGIEDAGELIAFATAEQLIQASDESLFVNDRPGDREVFDGRRFATWLEVLLEVGDEAAARRMVELDEDFVAHALSSLLWVLDKISFENACTSATKSGSGNGVVGVLDGLSNESKRRTGYVRPPVDRQVPGGRLDAARTPSPAS